MSTKKTMHLIVGLEMGGAEMMLKKITTTLKNQAPEDEIHVISLTDKGELGIELEEYGIEVHCLGLTAGRLSLKKISDLKVLLTQIEPDVVMCWMYHAILFGTIAKLLSRTKFRFLWNIRTALDGRDSNKKLTNFIIQINAYLSNLPDKIIYNSYRSKAQHEELSYSSQNALVIPNGFDIVRFSPMQDATTTISPPELQVPEGAHLVGTIGRYHPVKGFKYFVETADILSRTKKNVYFVMIGKHLDQDNQELMTMINRTQCRDRFILLGLRRDVDQLLPALSVYANTSTSEGFANVIGEAMASGVPCVVTDVGDSKKIVGACGSSIPSRDAEQMARAILDIINLPEDKKDKLRECSRARIVENFSIEAITKRYRDELLAS